jgi:hypothetical protein
MTITMKLPAAAMLALSLAAPAMAQQPAHEGDYYAPSKTIVQQPTAAQTKQAKEGDYYASGTTVVQQPTAAQLKKDQKGDYYAPTTK